MAKQELTDPKTSPDGKEDINIGSVDAEQLISSMRSIGYTHMIFRDTDYIYAINQWGKLVAGGPDAKNVSDATDFGEVLQTTVNNYSDAFFSIKIGPRSSAGDVFFSKTTANLDKVGTLWGVGGNRSVIRADSDNFTGDAFIKVVDPAAASIFRLDSIKFDGMGVADYGVYLDGVNEWKFLRCEARDINSYGFYAINTTANYNWIIESMFLIGAGIYIDSCQGLVIIGNQRYGSGTTMELSNVDPLVVGNNIQGTNAPDPSYTNCTFEEQYIKGGLRTSDDTKFFLGTDSDFSLLYDSTNDRLEIIDEINAVDLLRINKNGPIEVVQNLAVGPIEITEDAGAVTLADMPISGTPAAGTEESFTFAVDANNILKIYAEADGAGGIQNARLKSFKHLDIMDTNRQTLSGDLTLTASDAQIQSIDPGGAGRTITLPAEQNGLEFIIGNRADAAEDLTVNDDSATTIVTVSQDEVGRFISDGTGWIGFVSAGGVT